MTLHHLHVLTQVGKQKWNVIRQFINTTQCHAGQGLSWTLLDIPLFTIMMATTPKRQFLNRTWLCPWPSRCVVISISERWLWRYPRARCDCLGKVTAALHCLAPGGWVYGERPGGWDGNYFELHRWDLFWGCGKDAER